MFSFCSHEFKPPKTASFTPSACSNSVEKSAKSLSGTSSEFYFRIDELLRELANPNLHDIPTRLPFRVELWDRHDQHIRWVIAAASSVAVGHAALDAAIASYPEPPIRISGSRYATASRSFGSMSRNSSREAKGVDGNAERNLHLTSSRPMRPAMPRRCRQDLQPQRRQANQHRNGMFCRKTCVRPSST